MSPTKAIVLAAGKDAGSLLSKRLGEHSIVECVLSNVLQVVPADDLYLVGGEGLANGIHRVPQPEPLGTAHAVLQTAPALRDYRGNLLIVYGDTPLLRPASLRGLL